MTGIVKGGERRVAGREEEMRDKMPERRREMEGERGRGGGVRVDGE